MNDTVLVIAFITALALLLIGIGSILAGEWIKTHGEEFRCGGIE